MSWLQISQYQLSFSFSEPTVYTRLLLFILVYDDPEDYITVLVSITYT